MIQRCQWHKRENILKYLDKRHPSNFHRKLQSAHEQSTYDAAKKKLNLIKRELAIANQSAARSGVRFGRNINPALLSMSPKLGISFKTTNCIENIMRQMGIYTDRVST